MNAASDHLAFDVLNTNSQKVYAYGYKNMIRTYSYTDSSRRPGVFPGMAMLPQDWMVLTDIRFHPVDSAIYVTVQHSDTVYRCDAACPEGQFDVVDSEMRCQAPSSGPESTWIPSSTSAKRTVQCVEWAGNEGVEYGGQLAPPSEGYTVQGGCHVFDDFYLVCASGTYRTVGDINNPSAGTWIINANLYSGRNAKHKMYANIFGNMIGPPAYNKDSRMLYLLCHLTADNPFRVWQFGFTEWAGMSVNSLVYSHIEPVGSRKSPAASFVGASLRLDVGRLLAVDESVRKIFVLQISKDGISAVLMHSVSYGTSVYKDVEFVSVPSKLFMTSLEVPGNARAELYVQCAPCKNGGMTDSSKPGGALSQTDCIACNQGSFLLPNNGGCSTCQCKQGEFQNGGKSCSGTDTFNVACTACKDVCDAGKYINGTCDGKGTVDASICLACNTPSSSMCPASMLPEDSLDQENLCVASDCLRRQALFLPLDAWDVERDVGPRNLMLVPISVSKRSNGPQANFSSWMTGGSSASFNASNHEYYTIPPMLSLFDRSLGYMIVSNVSMWEQGMTLAFWVQFQASVGQWQSLVELSNGFDTEHIYIRRFASTSELAFGIVHSQKSVAYEFVTNGSSVLNVGKWRHVAWTVRPTLSHLANIGNTYDAIWNVYLDGELKYSGMAGVMPVDGPYTTNYVGYGTQTELHSFFSGQLDDLRLYERALTSTSVKALQSRDACCMGLVTAGTYMDNRRSCSGSFLYCIMNLACKQPGQAWLSYHDTCMQTAWQSPACRSL